MARRAPTTTRRLRAVVHATVLALAFVLVQVATANAGVLTTASSVSTTESGPAATYSVHLGADPNQDVDIHFRVPAGVEPIPPLRVTPADWNDQKPVLVRGTQDFVWEPTISGIIEHQVRSTTGATLSTWEMPVNVVVNDDDYPGVFLTPAAPGAVAVEGDTVRWNVRLASQPTQNVTLAFSVDPTEGQLLTPTVTFTPATWNVDQPIDVVANDNDVDEAVDARTALLQVDSVTSSDVDYNGRYVSPSWVDFTDDDVAGLVLDVAQPLSVTEGSPGGTYRIRLATEPAAPVTITPSPVGSDVVTTPPSLGFDSTNWNAWQTVTVDAVDDADPEPNPESDSVAHTFASGDPAYDGLIAPDVNVQVTDNDSPAFLVTPPPSTQLSEADSAGTERQVLVRLATAPPGNVTLTAVNDGQVIFASSNVLTFTPTNWSTTQTLRVRAYDDGIAETDPHPGSVSFTVSATGAGNPYASMTVPTLTFQVGDDDAANASLACAGAASWARDPLGRVLLAEDPTDPQHSVSCSFQLGSPSTSTTTISITSGGQLTPSTNTVTIPAGAQASTPVTFTATDDPVDEGAASVDTVTFAVSTVDPVYLALQQSPIDFEVVDDDVAGVSFSPGGPFTIAEASGDATFDVKLRSQPTSAVTISFNAGTQLQLLAPTGGMVTFTPTNWNVAQQVRVAAVNDPYADASTAAPLGVSVVSSDPFYNGLVPAPVPFDVTDDEVAAVVASPSGTDTATSEGGVTDTVDVKLGSQPTDDVTVTLAPDAQLTVVPATMTFTPANWNVAQPATVTAVQDTVFEGPHAGTLRLEPASTDPMYAGASPAASVTVQVADDEEGGATITESDAATGVAEAGATDTYTVVLKAQPTADVVIRSDGAPQVATTPAALTFTAANWNVPQAVTVAANQDDLDEADPHTQEIKHAVETTAAGWAGITVATITAKVTDDDSASVVVVETDGSTAVQEGGAGDMVTFRLASRPAGDVTITGKPDAQLSPVKAPIVLTPDAWNKPIELKVSAVADDENEGPHTGTMSFVVASGDPAYGKATVAPITVKITDDDSDVTIIPGTDGGGITEDDESGARDPRGTGDDESDETAGGSTDGDGSVERRTETGETRTDAGSERTDGGLGLIGTGTGGGDDEEVVDEEPAELEDEVVSASEPAAKEKPKKPNAVQRAMKKAVKWTKDNQETVATVGGVGLMATGAGTFLLRGDPIKVAQRGLSTALDSKPGKLPGGSDKPHPRVRRSDKPKRGRKKRRRDGDDDAPEGELAGDGAAPDSDS